MQLEPTVLFLKLISIIACAEHFVRVESRGSKILVSCPFWFRTLLDCEEISTFRLCVTLRFMLYRCLMLI